MIVGGYIKLWRKIWNDKLFKQKRKFSRFEAWIDMIMLAAGKDKEIIFDGNYVSVKRGQLLTSQRTLSERWNWSRTKVIHFLHILCHENRPRINMEKDQKKTIITITNYNKYNPLKKEEKPPQKNKKSHRKATEKPLKSQTNESIMKVNDINKNKKLKKNEEFEQEFNKFWDFYGFKINKRDAFKAFKALRRNKIDFEIIMKATSGYLQFLKYQKIHENFEQRQKYPAGFLRNEYWKDFLDFQYRPPM